VWLLGWVSLLTDVASEAIYPLLPLFLTVMLGARPLALGLIEGVAEATAALLKIASGAWSDRQGRRRPWVIAGYTVSALVRPAMALATGWVIVLALRFVDRVGKGIRSAPRDAMLASWAPPEARGRVFGFHRAMDHVGAILGPLCAAAFLWLWPGRYRLLFALTLIPGLAVVALVRRLPVEQARPADGQRAASPNPKPRPTLTGWQELPAPFFRALGVIGLFTLGNSTDAYLLLRLGQVLPSVAAVPLVWAALHVVKAATSVWGGWLADRVGRRAAIAAGWLVYAIVYLVFARAGDATTLLVAFLVYGLYFGLTEGPEKALVADWAPPALRGTAFGLYNAVAGLGALAASVVFGLVWEMFGASSAFALGAVLASSATLLLWLLVPVPVAASSPGGR
jgi:MFS family permease